ncbi:MAG: hypothetical protein ACJ76P_10750 [Actinomycetota bacterium]
MRRASEIIQAWPEESREPAQVVIDKYGEPTEETDSSLIWHGVGPWKRIVASKAFYKHEFPRAARGLGGVLHRLPRAA